MIDEGSARAKRCSSTFLASRRTFSFQGTVQDLDFNDTVGGLNRSQHIAHRASRALVRLILRCAAALPSRPSPLVPHFFCSRSLVRDDDPLLPFLWRPFDARCLSVPVNSRSDHHLTGIPRTHHRFLLSRESGLSRREHPNGCRVIRAARPATPRRLGAAERLARSRRKPAREDAPADGAPGRARC